MYLYLDTSHFLTLGVLDERFEWLEFKEKNQLQHSADIHNLIYETLDQCQLKAKNLKGLFVCNGPGSYTGIRLGEGIAQVFELLNVPIYSFHHFKVPKMLGFKSGQWSCHAFKGEIFNFVWDETKEIDELISSADWKPLQRNVFSNQTEGPWIVGQFEMIANVIKKSSKEFFPQLLNLKLREEPYYFRPLDKEFKRSVE